MIKYHTGECYYYCTVCGAGYMDDTDAMEHKCYPKCAHYSDNGCCAPENITTKFCSACDHTQPINKKDENICLKCRYIMDEKCPARKEFVDGSVGEMFAYAIACAHFAPQLILIKEKPHDR